MKKILLFVPVILLVLSALCFKQAFAEKPILPSLAPMLRPVMQAVVNISIQGTLPAIEGGVQNRESRPRKIEKIGSGVIVDAKKGYILTNDHVVRHAKIITVTLYDGRRVKAKLIGADAESDVAVLQIEAEKLKTIPLGDSDKMRVGDFVVAIGNPFGLNSLGTHQTATFGIVSALQRTELHIEGIENFIQTDAAINIGNSGGALVNTKGELLGINTAILSPYGGNVGVGFAIPINMAHDIMRQIIQYGSIHRGLMGIIVQHLTPELADILRVPNTKGALVTQVNPESPASRAGLKPGDIIQKINDEVINQATQVKTIVALLRVGSTVKLQILRDKKIKVLSVEVSDLKQFEEKLQAQDPFLYGLALRNFDQELPVQGRKKGVQVVGVLENSAGWRGGLRVGDVIMNINQQPVRNLQEMRSIASKTKDALLIHLMRGNSALYVIVK